MPLNFINLVNISQVFRTLLFFCLIFIVTPSFAFEVLQILDDVTVNRLADSFKDIITHNGKIKFTFNNNKYDLFADSTLSRSENVLSLAQGDLRVFVETFEGLQILTPVGAVSILNKGDYIIHYNEGNAQLIVEVFEGSALVRGFYREEALNVQNGERGGFKGIKENNELTYDILLKGRKSIRGNLIGPEKLPPEKLEELKLQYSIIIKPKVIKITKPKAKPGEICSDPFAKFNDCVWRCLDANNKNSHCNSKNLNVRCIRERCLANGTWGDKTEIKGEAAKVKCQGQLKVDVCNY